MDFLWSVIATKALLQRVQNISCNLGTTLTRCGANSRTFIEYWSNTSVYLEELLGISFDTKNNLYAQGPLFKEVLATS